MVLGILLMYGLDVLMPVKKFKMTKLEGLGNDRPVAGAVTGYLGTIES